MARPRRIDMELVARAQTAVQDATDVATLRQVQAVLLPALLGATLEQTAAALGVGRASLARLQAWLRRQGRGDVRVEPNWGGRRRAVLTAEQEGSFLAPGPKLRGRARFWWSRACGLRWHRS